METIDLINALNDAVKLIKTTREDGRLASGATAIWKLSYNAEEHLNKQIAELLQPGTAELNADLRSSLKVVEMPVDLLTGRIDGKDDWRDREKCPVCHEYNVHCTCNEEADSCLG